jgi:serine/threonine-protein kinase
VAVKLLRPETPLSPELALRTFREARAAASITSEHVTRVLDVGQLDSGEAYLVMELLEGADLGQLLEANGPLPVRDVATYLLQACEAIAEAHAHGIVHRDLKPSNLFLAKRPDGSPLVKLLDFGISKMLEETTDQTLTGTYDTLGTPHYMSPEQLLSTRNVDTRADVWALGVIAYRLLTGERPFEGETTPSVHIAIASQDPAPIRKARPDLPAALEDLVARCLIKSRLERLQTVGEFAAALLPFADADTQRRYAHVAAGAPPPRMPRRSRRDIALAVSGVLLVAVASSAVVLLKRSGPSPTPPAVSADPAAKVEAPGTTAVIPSVPPTTLASEASMPASKPSSVPAPSRQVREARSSNPAPRHSAPTPAARDPYDDRR